MKFKPWVIALLTIVNICCVFIAAGECENDKVFLIKTIVCILILIFNSISLYLYGGLKDDVR